MSFDQEQVMMAHIHYTRTSIKKSLHYMSSTTINQMRFHILVLSGALINNKP